MNFDFDEKQTRKNVKLLLKNARRIRAIVESQSYVRSPVMSHEPVARSNINPETVARMAIEATEATEEWEAINEAVKLLSDEYQSIVSKKYLVRNPLQDVDMYMGMNLASSSYYRKVDKALVEFAFCYRGGELVVWSC